LCDTTADWNLLVACDMPNVTPAFLESLLLEAQRTDADALLPAGPSGLPEPLCAVYHKRCFPAIDDALRSGRWKVTVALSTLKTRTYAVDDDRWFENANTPADWERILQERGARTDQ
jgi:molybdopterin-guanine dinucleotide biosynthesis protein A